MKRASRACLCGVLLLGVAGIRADAGEAQTDVQKATVVYNLSKFIRWPQDRFATPDTPLNLCVLGNAPFTQALADTVAGKQSQRRLLRVTPLTQAQEALADCHVLYLNPTEAQALPNMLATVQGSPILTVSDAKGFVQQGGIIGLFSTGERVRFEINLDVARRNAIHISASLLELAQHVHYTAADSE